MAVRTEPRAGSQLSVLVVEDDESFRETVAEALEATGYAAVQAVSPSEALRLAASDAPIHVVLADVVLPEMSGPELAGLIHDEHPEVPVIFMSGYTEDALHEQGLLPPESSSLQKPFGLTDLRTRIRDSVQPPVRRER